MTNTTKTLEEVKCLLGVELTLKHARGIHRMIRHGFTPEVIETAVRWNERMDHAIATMTCPECGKPIVRTEAFGRIIHACSTRQPLTEKSCRWFMNTFPKDS